MTTGEDTNVIVKKIGALIDVDINDTDISISNRIPSSNDGASGSTSFRHPAIVIFHIYLILTPNVTHLPKLILITLIYINFTAHLKLILAQIRHFHYLIVI